MVRTNQITTVIENAADRTNVRILHLTDPHLLADVAGELRGRVTFDCLSAVIGHIRHSEWQADLALVTGDLVQDDTPEAYEHCGRLLTMLQMPVFCVPGNHDVPDVMRDVLKRWSFRYCAAEEIGPWLIAGVDSCEPGAVAGRISDPELRRLESLQQESAAPFALLALHHPPVAVGTRWLDDVGLQNAREFLGVVDKGGKKTVTLFGHVHQAFDTTRNSVRIIGTPSTCRQFLPGSDSFAVDDLPPAYRRLDLHADGHIDTEVIWVG